MHERLDPVLLPLLAREAVPLTAVQIRERCEDPWAGPLVEEWLRDAFERRLVRVRGGAAGLPSEWSLTPKGTRRAAASR
jgi:hypothetical protein